jgi:hypothetical protein
MKKSLLSLILGCSVLLGYSQKSCVPDNQYSGGGIYPDTANFNLTSGFVGQPYNQLITIITPTDTAVEVFGSTITAEFESIELTSVAGLPANFAYTCDPPDCIFPGGTTKCADLYSTTDPTTPGVYPITFVAMAHLYHVLTGQVDCTYVVDGYILEIVDNTTSIINQFNNQTFELRSPFPNPVENHAKIQFISGKSDDIVFRVYNLLGKQIYLRKIRATRGVNTIDINTSSYSEGIYLYSINNGRQVITKRMVVKN